MRHFAIYSQLWPARLASQVATAVPREDGESSSRRPVQRNISAPDAKHAAVDEERPAKRRKTEQGPVVAMSDKAKELLMAPKRKRGRPRKHPLDEIPKRKRGRPRKSSPVRSSRAPPHLKAHTSTPVNGARPPISSPVSVKSRSELASPSISRGILKPKSLAVKLQPRDSNGRFGKKATTNGRFVRKRVNTARSGSSRAQVSQRAKVEQWLGDKRAQLETNAEAEDLPMLASRKRGRTILADESPRPSKKVRGSHSGDGDEGPVPHNPSGSSLLKFKGLNASLLCRPNPTNFARRAWAPPPPEISSPDGDGEGSLPTIESESNGPVTPQDRTPLPIPSPGQFPFQGEASIHTKSEEPACLPTPRRITHNVRAILTFKPSPIHFSSRRWALATKSPLESGTGTRRSQRLRPRSSLPDENNLSLDTSPSEISSALSTRTTLAGRSVLPQKSTILNVAQAMPEAATDAVRMVSCFFILIELSIPAGWELFEPPFETSHGVAW